MLKYYQELLNECIDLSEHKKKHKEMKSTLNKIKNLIKRNKNPQKEWGNKQKFKKKRK